jgi:hypothetical protein
MSTDTDAGTIDTSQHMIIGTGIEADVADLSCNTSVPAIMAVRRPSTHNKRLIKRVCT